MVIPANSKIIDVVVDLSTAANATTNLSVGDTVGGATHLNTLATGQCWLRLLLLKVVAQVSGQTLAQPTLN